jgi:hypothetical protein
VALISSTGATIGDGQATGTIENDDAPKVAEVTIGDGDEQRSKIDSIAITFDSAIDVDQSSSDAFILINRDSGATVNLVPTVFVQSGIAVVTLGFADGPSVESSVIGSPTLADGRYQLTLLSNRISIGNVALDGNSDGAAGGDFVFGNHAADQFFRFFGDSDGDGDVDGQDYGRFGLTFLRSSPDPAFDPAFDFDGDNDVDGQDYGRFGLRFLRQVGAD